MKQQHSKKWWCKHVRVRLETITALEITKLIIHSLSRERARTRVYTRSFMFFTVTSVTHPLNHYISRYYKHKRQIWTRKRFTSPFFLMVWQQKKRILQSRLPCFSALFFIMEWMVWQMWQQKNIIHGVYARARGGRSKSVHQNIHILTSQNSITTTRQNFSSLFCEFSTLWGNITTYIYRGNCVMLQNRAIRLKRQQTTHLLQFVNHIFSI